jgi:hypothetical protein
MSQTIRSTELRRVIEAGELPPQLPKDQLLALSDPDADVLTIAHIRSAIVYAAGQLQHSALPVQVGGEGERLYHEHDMGLIARAILTETSHNMRENDAVCVELGLTNEV